MTGCRRPKCFKNFGFGGVSDKEFAVPQGKWRCQPISWILYRYAVAIYFLVWLGLVIAYWGVPPFYTEADTKVKWLIYVSNWTYATLCLYFLMSAIGTTVYHMRTRCKVSSESINENDKSEEIRISTIGASKEGPNSYGNPAKQKDVTENGTQDIEIEMNDQQKSEPATLSWYFKLTWLLQDLCYSGALFVTILFWVLDYDPATSTISVFNLHVHGVNLLFVLIDMFLIASPYRLLHFIYPAIYAWIYFVFTLIYYAAGGMNERPFDPVNGNTYLYLGTLDWEGEPVTSAIVMVIVVFVAAPVLHFLFWGMYQLRRCASRRGCCECC